MFTAFAPEHSPRSDRQERCPKLSAASGKEEVGLLLPPSRCAPMGGVLQATRRVFHCLDLAFCDKRHGEEDDEDQVATAYP